MGLDTGIDLEKLIAARAILADGAARRAALRLRAGRRAAEGLPHAARRRRPREASPLEGIRVVEFVAHGDGPELRAGARRPRRRGDQGRAGAGKGDHTRQLTGTGAGFFADLQPQQEERGARPRSRPRASRWRGSCSPPPTCVIENFRPGALDEARPRLRGREGAEGRTSSTARSRASSPGPYEHRTALDEVVQMMGGLAYMTGPPGRPLRAGASVNDMMGGMFGAIAILAALHERDADRAGPVRAERRCSRTTSSSSRST